MDQYTALTIIGAVILIIGLILWSTKRKLGGIVTLLCALWLFTMVLYYALTYAGIYGQQHIVNNLIGVAILVVGAIVTLSYLRKAWQGGGKRARLELEPGSGLYRLSLQHSL